MPAGSSATVAVQAVPTVYVESFTELRLGATVIAQPVRDEINVSVTLSWPAEPEMERYEVYVSCPTATATATTGTSITILVAARCADPLDAIVIARDLDNLIAPEAQVATGVSSPVGFGSAWQSLGFLTGQVTGLPTDLSSGPTLYGRALISPDRLPTGMIAQSLLAPDGTLSTPLELPPTISPIIELELRSSSTRTQAYRERAGTPYNRNLDGVLLPWFASTTADLATRTVAWTSTPPSGTGVVLPDAAAATIAFTRPGLSVFWTVFAPAAGFTATTTAGTIALPDLPGDHGFEPESGDTLLAAGLTLISINPGADLDRLIEHGDRALRDLDVWGDPTLTRITTSSSAK
jgi:hypothetical protein